MKRTIKDAAVKRFRYQQRSVRLADHMAAYNYARRLKTFNGLKPYDCIAKSGVQGRKATPSIRYTGCAG